MQSRWVAPLDYTRGDLNRVKSNDVFPRLELHASECCFYPQSFSKKLTHMLMLVFRPKSQKQNFFQPLTKGCCCLPQSGVSVSTYVTTQHKVHNSCKSKTIDLVLFFVLPYTGVGTQVDTDTPDCGKQQHPFVKG